MQRIIPGADLCGITDYPLSRGRNNIEVAQMMLEAGIRLIQYRDKERKMGVMYEECKAIRDLTKTAGATFIVNDHVDIALLVDADGVHIGQEDLPVSAVRSLLGKDKIIGLSTHSPAQAKAAVEAGVTYIGVGPIFATKTKKDVCDPVGLEYLEHVVKTYSLPFIAIGGIKSENIAEVTARGAKCCALVSAIVGAEDIGRTIAELRKNMEIKQE